MRHFITNIFLPGFSIISLLFSISDVCYNEWWFWVFVVFSLLLIAVGAYLLAKHLAKKSVSWVILSAGILIFLTAGCNRYIQKENSQRNELWRDYVKSHRDKEQKLTDLEKSAIIDKDARSEYNLAYNLVYGRDGYKFDFAKAKEYAQESADQGNPKAHALLAIIYSKGYGCQPNYQQAFSNLILSIKGGYEQSMTLLPLLDSASFKISPKDSLVLQECVHNRAYLDSLYDVVSTSFTTKGMESCYSIVRAHKDRCSILSELGYYRATELLYFESFGDPNQTEQLHHYAEELAKYDRIPDMPTMRSFFFQALDGIIKYSGDKEVVEHAIANQDYWNAIIWNDYDKEFIHDITYRYEFDLAFYERSRYLLANRDNLNSLFFGLNEDLDRIHEIARKNLSDCILELRKEMLNKPFLFAKDSAK